MADLQGIGNLLQGMGAGFAGFGPQHAQAQAIQQETAFLNDERRRKALIRDFATVYSLGSQGQWDSATKLLENRVQHIQTLKGDPSDTLALLNTIKAGKTDEALSELGAFMQAGVLAGDIESPTAQGGMASAKTRQFVDGTVQMVMPDGSVQVVLPNGQRVQGEEARAAMQNAMANEVNYAGQRSGAAAMAQQGAQFQYAAPIAGAQAQARADVEAATAPQIAADTTAAKEGAKFAAERENAQRGNATAFDAYQQAMNGIRTSFAKTDTGPIAGRMPAVTAGQQTAEGAIAAAAPVLKQLFRSAGEGVFTDKDQQLLIDMLPKRTDHPEVVESKLGMIDSVVAAKLNMSGAPAAQPVPRETPRRRSTDTPNVVNWDDL